MQITVNAPDGDYCNGCDVLNFNYIDMVNSVQNIHVSCRKLKVTWISQTKEVVKHHDCPTLRLVRFEDGKPTEIRGAVLTGKTKDTRKAKVDW